MIRRTLVPGFASVLVLAITTGGCTLPGPASVSELTASAPPAPPPVTDQARLRSYAQEMGARNAANPDDRAVALRYAAALRGLDRQPEAVAVLQRVAAKNPHDLPVLGAYGKALADAGRLQEAADVLQRSHTPDHPNWTILSAQGSVADQQGAHDRAQAYYAAALKIAPEQPQVLSNLGLSYALERRMALAEATLRRAAAQPGADARVRQNLALVLTLEGKGAAAETALAGDLAPIDAAETVQAFKRTASDANTGFGGGTTVVAAEPRRAVAAARARPEPARTAAAELR